MKKVFAALLALVLCFSCLPALAAGASGSVQLTVKFKDQDGNEVDPTDCPKVLINGDGLAGFTGTLQRNGYGYDVRSKYENVAPYDYPVEGVIFNPWKDADSLLYTNPLDNNAYTGSEYACEKNAEDKYTITITLTKKVKATYLPGAGTLDGSGKNVAYYKSGTGYVLPGSPQGLGITPPNGKNLAGWRDSDGNIYKIAQWFTFTEDITFTAVWSDEVISASGNYLFVVANNGTDDVKLSSIQDPSGEIELPACTFKKDGYVFDSWNTKADGSGDKYMPGNVVDLFLVGSFPSIYAQWKQGTAPTSTPAPTKAPAVCLAIYYANGGQGAMKPQTLSGSSAVLNKNIFTRDGYEFIGWNTSADGTGDSYADGAKVPARNSIILYAQWKKVDAPVVTAAPTAVPTAVPTPVVTAAPTVSPVVTAAPTATPIVTAEPTVTPVVTAEPTATPVVTVPPVGHELKIVKQPEDQYVVEGQRAAFSIEAVGEGLNYQWYINRGNGWAKLDNAIGASYTTSVVDANCDGFEYKCVVTDRDGCRTESETAALYVAEAPAIPETGDSANPVLWISMALLGLAGLILLRRKQYN